MKKVFESLIFFLFMLFSSQAWATFLLVRTQPVFVPYANRQQIVFSGDSITAGNGSTSTGGYRHDLLTYLTDYYDNVTPNVIGGDYANSFSYPIIGLSGITSATLKTTYVEPQLAAIPSVTMPTAPDVVFLLIGTNDFLTSVSKATWLSNLTSIISSFRTANANCHIFVGNLIDRSTYTATVTDWNSSLATTLAGISGYNTFIHPVDLYTAMGPYGATYYGDVTHPNTAGYSLLASAWWTAYQSVF